MGAISRINKSSLNQRTKTQLRKALVENQSIKVLSSNYTHTQSNTTLANISGFRLPVDAGKTYKFTASLVATATSGAGAKFAITAPTAAYLTGQVQYDGTSASAPDVASLTAGVTAAAAVEFFAIGTYKAAASGYFQVQGAQNASGANDTVFLAGSFIQLEEVLGA